MNGKDSCIGGLSSTTFRQEYVISRTLIFQTGKKPIFYTLMAQILYFLRTDMDINLKAKRAFDIALALG